MKSRHCTSRCLALLAAMVGALLAAGAARAADGDEPQATAPERGPTSLPFPITSVVSDDYKLQPYDLVVFELFDEPDATTEQRISGKGDLRLPMIGTVHLAGRSVREAEEQMESLYRVGGFYTKPQVMLFVAQHSDRMISVIGQVNKPDRVELPVGTDEMGLAQAIAMTGGLTRIAKATAIQVSRVEPDGKERRFVVNFGAYLDAAKSGNVPDFELKADDVVYVPERTI